MTSYLEGKNAVVTGAGRGIGRATAIALAAEGVNVVVNDPGVARGGSGGDKAPADEVVKEIEKMGGKAVANYESVADFSAAGRIIKSCVDNFGRIDILINCAGVLVERMIFNMSPDEWDVVVKTHLYGAFSCCQHACVVMKEQRYGRIINMISVAWKGALGQCNYAAAKGGMISLTRSIAREMGRYNVTCNAVDPAAATRMTLDEGVKEGMRKRLESGLITKEQYEAILDMPGPEGVPPLILYLCTDQASHVSGSVFHSDATRIFIYSEPMEDKFVLRDYKKEGVFTLEELNKIMPQTLLAGYVSSAAPAKK